MRIEVVDASISFGDRRVFDGFDARFEPGCVTALVGPSGSGKSSLLAAMGGYQKLTRGSIQLISETGSAPPTPSLVAWVPQGSNALKARTALDNVCITPLAEGRSLSEARTIAKAALAKVGLSAVEGQIARTLSGGELQRLAFARALAGRKPLMFADEPSASLDETNTRAIARLLADIDTTAIVIVATHDPVLIESADIVVSLRSSPAYAA